MPSQRLIRTAVICAVLATGATACGGQKDAKSTAGAAVAPASASVSASAPASPTASPTPTMATDSLTAEQISTQAKTAMSQLSSMKIAGTMTSDGQKMGIDITADKQGDCDGTISIGSTGSIEILHTGSNTWMKPDATFWKSMSVQEGYSKAGDTMAMLFQGRWLTGGQNDPDLKDVGSMCDLMNQMTKDDGSKSTVTKGTTGVTDGVPTISLTETDSDDPTPSTAYIATVGQPYLVRIEQSGGDSPGQMDFSAFNQPVTVQAPPADDVIDYSLFQQKVKGA
ncbi:hypothetical protein ACIGXM_06050 [Kitasatospora sp. NPDC052896]|uniref:hypothetical protein n=1 Tax=Kitasatospora sp. NPDC052896 TaxID=3364061 RepID=UPI0037C8E8AC